MVIQVNKLVAALEAYQSVGLEGWWDTLVGAIVGAEKIDDYRGNKTPFSNDYRKLIRSTFGNSSWVKSLELIDTDVSAGGIASRISTADGKTYWDKVQTIIANAKWLDDYADIIDDHSTKVATIHKKLMRDWKLRGEESNLEIWKAAIAELKALDDPLDWAGAHSKPGIKGKLVKTTGSVKWSLSKPEVAWPKVLPPLTQEQLNFAIKFIVDISNDSHEMSKAYLRLYQVADYPTVDGESDIDDEMLRLDDTMFHQYKRLTDVESVCDRVYKLAPGYGDHYELAAALVIWVVRSTGSTGASLESFDSSGNVTVEMIARTAHEAVRSLAQSYGDNSHLSWEDSPEWVRTSGLNGAALHVLNPELTAEQTHEAWLKAKQEEGWSCGPTKDADRKEHPCMVPYAELSQEHRMKDHLFKSIVDAFMACLREGNPEVQVVGLECACGSLEQRYEGSLDSRTGLAVSLESGLIGKLKDWFLGDDKDLPADLDEALRKTNGLIKKAWLDQQEFDSGNIDDPKLVSSLTFGKSPISGSDTRVVTSSSGDLYDWIDRAYGHWDDAVANAKPIVEAGLKQKKLDKAAIKAAFIEKLPPIEVRLPDGKVFECSKNFYGIRDYGVGKSVPKLKADQVLKMQDVFIQAVSTAADGMSDLKHHYLEDDVWSNELEEVAEIEDSSNNWLGDSLSFDWYFKPIFEAFTLVANNQTTLVNWVKASIKAKK